MATLNPALKDFWTQPARNRVLYGGRSSSKSWDAAGFSVFLASNYKVRFLCARQFQNKIAESVYTLIKIQIERFGLSGEFDILNNIIRHKRTGSEFLFYGLWRHIDEIKSLEGVDVCWIEEAHNLSEEQWKILEPTVRKDGSQFWIIFNPRFSNDFVYRRFVTNTPPDTIVRKINYQENPFLSKTMIKVIDAAKQEDYDEYLHVYEGVAKDDDDSAVIKRRWLHSAIDAHKKISGDWFGGKVVGYDVADDGGDKNAVCINNGSVLIHIDEWKANEDELYESAKKVFLKAKRFKAASIGYDSIGVGAGTGAHLNNLKWNSHFKFNAAGKVQKPKSKYAKTNIKNEDYFANLKAQAWWSVSDRLRNTHLAITKGEQFNPNNMISISSECDSKLLNKLIDELATPLRDFDNSGRVKVESKKDLAKREIKSPNLADAFIISHSRGILGNLNYKELL